MVQIISGIDLKMMKASQAVALQMVTSFILGMGYISASLSVGINAGVS